MNYSFHKLFARLALPALIAFAGGCTSDLTDRGARAVGEELFAPVRISVTDRLRATGDDTTPTPTAALEREKTVNTLHAVVFKSNGLFYNTFECTPVPGEVGAYSFDMKKEGTFQFVLVANADAQLLAEIDAKVSVFSALQNAVVKKALGNDNTASDFVLTSERAEVTTKKGTNATPDPGVIRLRRLAARFDILNRVSGLKLTKVTYGKRLTESHLYSRPTIAGLRFEEDQQSYTAAEGLKPKSAVGMIYGYENPNQNETAFTIEGTYNGKPIKPHLIELTNLTVKRNHLYTIVISSRGGKVEPGAPGQGDTEDELRLDVDVIDWESGGELSVDESIVLKAIYVDHEASVSNASFMTPYLKQSPSEIFTVTRGESEVTIAVGTYMEAGTLEIKGNPPAGVSLQKKGAPTTTPTGKIIQEYTLTLPAMNRYADIVATMTDMPFKQEGFMEVELVAKNSTSDAEDEFVVRHGRMKTPLEHLSEYGLAKKVDGAAEYAFKETHDNTQQDYFDLLTQADEIKDLTIGGVRYHLPKDYHEFASIFPYTANDGSETIGSEAVSKVYQEVIELVVLPRLRFVPTTKGEKPAPMIFRADYSTPSPGKISYALKLKTYKKKGKFPGSDGSFLTAYRYEWVGDFFWEDSEEGFQKRDKTSHLKVTSRFLGRGWKGTIADIATEDFWEKDNRDDASRIFPMADSYDNYYVLHNMPYLISRQVGIVAFFATDTRNKINKDYWRVLYVSKGGARANSSTFVEYSPKLHVNLPVRLFTHEL